VQPFLIPERTGTFQPGVPFSFTKSRNFSFKKPQPRATLRMPRIILSCASCWHFCVASFSRRIL